jgi:type II secretory pathway component GspD/PulD (secretin)
MKTILLLVTCTAMLAHAQQFQLQGRDGALTGPFEFEEGATVSIGDSEARIVKGLTKREGILAAMEAIRIPEIDFRQANIRDVVDFLSQASVECGPPSRGVSMILKLDSSSPVTVVVPADPFADPFAAPVEVVETNAVSDAETLVTFSALDITLKEALDIVVDVAGLKYQIRGSVVLITESGWCDEEMEFRMYEVLPPGGVRIEDLSRSCCSGGKGESHDPEADLKAFFGEMGVSWPTGSSIKYVRGLGKLVVRNTVENLEAFERVLGMLNVQPCQIEIEAQFVAFDPKDIGRLALTGITTDSLLALWKDGRAELLSAPRIVTQSGQQATIKGVTEYIYPTDFTVAHDGGTNASAVVGAVVVPSSFETREVGTILEVMPEVSPDGGMINLTLSPELVLEPTWQEYGVPYTDSNGNQQEPHMPQPFFKTCHFRTSILIASGHRILITGGTPTRDGEQIIYTFIMARIIGIRGQEISR